MYKNSKSFLSGFASVSPFSASWCGEPNQRTLEFHELIKNWLECSIEIYKEPTYTTVQFPNRIVIIHLDASQIVIEGVECI